MSELATLKMTLLLLDWHIFLYKRAALPITNATFFDSLPDRDHSRPCTNSSSSGLDSSTQFPPGRLLQRGLFQRVGLCCSSSAQQCDVQGDLLRIGSICGLLVPTEQLILSGNERPWNYFIPGITFMMN